MMRLLVLEPVQSFTLRFRLRMVTSMALESRRIRRGTRHTWGGWGRRAWPRRNADGLFCQSCGRHALLMRGLIFRWWGGSSSGLRHGLYHYQKRPPRRHLWFKRAHFKMYVFLKRSHVFALRDIWNIHILLIDFDNTYIFNWMKKCLVLQMYLFSWMYPVR